MKKKSRSTVKPSSPGPKRDRKSRRNVVVLASLLGSLSVTSALLLLLAPAPLVPNARSLVATTAESVYDQVFETDATLEAKRWQYIYIHHAQARRGSIAMLGQANGGFGGHFLIGNGDGCEDGAIEIGQRWLDQQSASLPGADLPNQFLSICLVGDLNAKRPTAAQMRALENLVQSLQRRLGIPGKSVVTDARRGDVAGIGKQFPQAEFRARVLP